MAVTDLLPDFTPLNPAEREVLALLAQGHTAKSIATLTGKTEGSVNERLREARRKTGVASSRELARLFAQAEPPKNRDKQIGVADPASSDAAPEPQAVRRLRGLSGKGVVIMAVIAATIGLFATASFLQIPAPEASGARDPLLGNILAEMPSASPKALYAELRGERRDEAWAKATEPAIHALFVKIAGVGIPGDTLRVTCGTTLCEAVGVIPADDSARVAGMMQAVQGVQLSQGMEGLGLTSEMMTFGSPSDRRALFMTYWRRK